MNLPAETSGGDPLPSLLLQAAQAFRSARPADALAALREAVRLRPSDAATQRDIGLVLLEAGDFEKALACFERALALDASFADAWLRIGIAMESLGDAPAALGAYERATATQPSLAEAWYRGGALAHAMNRQDDAVARFRRASEADAKSRFGRLGAARDLLTRNCDQEAERVLRKAVTVDPDNALAHDLLGHLLSDWGRFEEARECFERAVTLDPMLAGSYYDLVRCRRVTADDAALSMRMEAALATPGLAPAQRLRIHLAMGKAADDVGDYARAMKHFDAADALRPGSVEFDAAAFDDVVDRIIERCNPQAMARAAAHGNSSAVPILIVGMPRSGTTLVEHVVASHPDVHGGGELPFWLDRGAAWHLSDAAAKDENFLRQSATQYLDILRGLAPKSARVTDKMPFNVLWAGAIHLALPNAVILHCRRAPIDTALSIHQTLFHPELGFPTGGPQLVAYFGSYERLTRHWRQVLPANRYIEVDYESLTRDPEPEIRRIVSACGLAWNDACLQPHLKPGAVRTPSNWQARRPIHRDSVERWRHYEPYLGALRELLEEPSRKGDVLSGGGAHN